MKTILLTSRAIVPLLLPGNLEGRMNWASWETTGHGSMPGDRARARVQYILDAEEGIRDGDLSIVPRVYYPSHYCPEATLSLVVGVDMHIPQIERECPTIYPAIEVQYALCVYSVATRLWKEMVSSCTYLVPRLHPSEHNVPPDGTGPFTIMDILGGVLSTHVEGTEPVHMLRELMRSMGHLPHEFVIR